jgi:hypothetical protein
MRINGDIQEESCGNFHEFYEILYNLICREWGICLMIYICAMAMVKSWI